MLTFFTMPKAFEGHFDRLQRNAIQSWIRAIDDCEVILMGDDPGTAEYAKELGIRHIKEIHRNDQGTPCLADMYAKAHKAASFDHLCYINADIVLLGEAQKVFEKVKSTFDRFLIIGRRHDAQVDHFIEYLDESWEEKAIAFFNTNARRHETAGIDYFIFPRGIYEPIPAFALGRGAFDNWFIYHAVSQGIPCVDATEKIKCMHQDHDYHHQDGQTGRWDGPQVKYNHEIAGGENCLYRVDHATYKITKDWQIKKRLFLPPKLRTYIMFFKKKLGLEP